MNKEYKLTQSGVDDLRAELSSLIDERGSVVEKLKNAREFGDLSENAEYHAARDELSQLDNRVEEIETILKNVKLIDEPADNSKVSLGNTVELANDESAREVIVVGSVEADPLENKISDESPLGKAILGKKIGDRVEISAPSGASVYIIKKIR